jgi:hypothetical protein
VKCFVEVTAGAVTVGAVTVGVTAAADPAAIETAAGLAAVDGAEPPGPLIDVPA